MVLDIAFSLDQLSLTASLCMQTVNGLLHQEACTGAPGMLVRWTDCHGIDLQLYLVPYACL